MPALVLLAEDDFDRLRRIAHDKVGAAIAKFFAIARKDKDRAATSGLAARDIDVFISDHPALREIDPVVARSFLKHAGAGFATRGRRVRGIRAIIRGIH